MSAVHTDTLNRVMQAIEYIAQGRVRTEACKLAGTKWSTVKKIIENTPELHEAFINASQCGFDTMADALLHINSDPTYGSSDPKVMAIMSSNIKWYLERIDPERYGARATVIHQLTADKTITDALEAAKARAHAVGVVVEGTFEVVEKETTRALEYAPAEVAEEVFVLDDELKQFV